MTTPPTQRGPKHLDRVDHRGGADRRIVIIDSDHRVRDSFAGLIALAGGANVVATTGQPAEALAAVRRGRPDVVVLDPRLPELEEGLTLIEAIHRIRPEVRVLVLGWSGDHEEMAMAAGADGFICKSGDPVTIVEAVLAVALHPGDAGASVVRPEIARS
jgi:DNA-binding NarL/FixJ family response regulator